MFHVSIPTTHKTPVSLKQSGNSRMPTDRKLNKGRGLCWAHTMDKHGEILHQVEVKHSGKKWQQERVYGKREVEAVVFSATG